MAECKECGKTMGFADKVNAKSFVSDVSTIGTDLKL